MARKLDGTPRLPYNLKPTGSATTKVITSRLETVIAAASLRRRDRAIVELFRAVYIELLTIEIERGQIHDYVDLETVAFRSIPLLATYAIEKHFRRWRRTYPLEPGQYLGRVIELLLSRLDPAIHPLLRPLLATEERTGERIAVLLVKLQENMYSAARSVLIGGPPQPTPTVAEIKAARDRRIRVYMDIHKLKGVVVRHPDIAYTATVTFSGNSSYKRYRSGRLPDSSAVSKRIEAVLNFRIPLKVKPKSKPDEHPLAYTLALPGKLKL